jgi:GTP-binding protein
MPFKIAIIGRPNVGKSTLFNRLTRTKHAIVHNMPGVTRDRREGEYTLKGRKCVVIDTPGLEEEPDEEKLENRMMLQTKAAVEAADICLMVIDGRAGVTPVDVFFASWLRRSGKMVITVVNKCEGSRGASGESDAYALGFKQVVAISAEHNEGITELEEVMSGARYQVSGVQADDVEKAEGRRKYGKKDKHSPFSLLPYSETSPTDISNLTNDNCLQLAIIGRPNTGKSTLLNHLFGSDRVLTGPEAGLTRDSIAVDLEIDGRKIKLIDTAGIRKKANVKKTVEKLSVNDSLHAIRFCHVAILMLDATQALEKQDLTLADLVEREGRAIVIALNKWDLVHDKDGVLKEIRARLNEIMQQIKDAPLVTISALHGKNVDRVINAAFSAYETWNKRVGTGQLNNWLKEAESRHIPPMGNNGRRIRLKYITQGNIRPPTFTLFVNNQKDLPESYKRYLANSLRDDLNLPGVPIRLMIRSSENPYAEKE